MEYIIIALCVLIAILMIVLAVISSRRANERSSYIKRMININSENSRTRQELETAFVRIKNLNSDVVAYQQIIEKLKIEKSKALSSNTDTITSDDLNERLRFSLPGGEIANTVKVKLERDGEDVIGVVATVRKKIGGKFTDVVVDPIVLPASLN